MRILFNKLINIIIVLTFCVNNLTFGLSPLPVTAKPEVMRALGAALESPKIKYANTEYAKRFLEVHLASAMLLRSGRILLPAELEAEYKDGQLVFKHEQGNPLALITAIRHEQFELLFQLLELKHPEKYEKIRKTVLDFYPKKAEDTLGIDLFVNHTMSQAMQWITMLREKLIDANEIPKNDMPFVTEIYEFIIDNEYVFVFEGEKEEEPLSLFIEEHRLKIIKKAATDGERFKRATSKSAIKDGLLRARVIKSDPKNKGQIYLIDQYHLERDQWIVIDKCEISEDEEHCTLVGIKLDEKEGTYQKVFYRKGYTTKPSGEYEHYDKPVREVSQPIKLKDFRTPMTEEQKRAFRQRTNARNRDKNFSLGDVDEKTEIHPAIYEAAKDGRLLAVYAKDLTGGNKIELQELANIMTNNLYDIPYALVRKKIVQTLISIDTDLLNSGLKEIFKILKETNESVPRNLRIAIVKEKDGELVMCYGDEKNNVLAHAGKGKKTKTDKKSIYMGLNVLLRTIQIGDTKGLKEIIEHELRDLKRGKHEDDVGPNAKTLYSDLLKEKHKRHYVQKAIKTIEDIGQIKAGDGNTRPRDCELRARCIGHNTHNDILYNIEQYSVLKDEWVVLLNQVEILDDGFNTRAGEVILDQKNGTFKTEFFELAYYSYEDYDNPGKRVIHKDPIKRTEGPYKIAGFRKKRMPIKQERKIYFKRKKIETLEKLLLKLEKIGKYEYIENDILKIINMFEKIGKDIVHEYLPLIKLVAENIGVSNDKIDQKLKSLSDTNIAKGNIPEEEINKEIEKAVHDGRALPLSNIPAKVIERGMLEEIDKADDLALLMAFHLYDIDNIDVKNKIKETLEDIDTSVLFEGIEYISKILYGKHEVDEVRIVIIVEKDGKPVMLYKDKDNNVLAHANSGKKQSRNIKSIYFGYNALKRVVQTKDTKALEEVIEHEIRDILRGHHIDDVGSQAQQLHRQTIGLNADVEDTVMLAFDLLQATKTKQKKEYIVRYNKQKLPEQSKEILDNYAKLLERASEEQEIEIKFIPSVDLEDKLFEVQSDLGNGEQGQSTLEIESEINMQKYPLRLVGLLNIAIASATVPDNALNMDKTDFQQYDPILGYIRAQIRSLNGREVAFGKNISKIMALLRNMNIWLPPCKEIDVSEHYAKMLSILRAA